MARVSLREVVREPATDAQVKCISIIQDILGIGCDAVTKREATKWIKKNLDKARAEARLCSEVRAFDISEEFRYPPDDSDDHWQLPDGETI